MATIGSTYLFGFGVGDTATTQNKQDVLDMVVNIDPYDTPFTTSAPKTKASFTTHEWIQDTLAAAVTGGAAEGADFGTPDISARTRVTNITQIFRKDLRVSNTQRAVSPYGIRDEYAYQVMKATREIARNIELSMFTNQTTATGTTAAGRIMKTIPGFLTTNSPYSRGTALGNASANGTSTGYPIYEGDFNAMLELIYTQGGNPDSVYVSPGVKRYMSKYGGAASGLSANYLELRRNIGAAERRLVRAINVYESDFGVIQIVLDRWVPQATATASATEDVSGRMFFLERSRHRLAFLRPMRHIPLAPNGDSTRGIVLGELTYECLAQKGSGQILNVSPRD